MSKNDFLGGFIGNDNPYINNNSGVPDGVYSSGDQMKMKYENSWPEWDADRGFGVYINRTTQSSGSITIPGGLDYVFISAAGGGGSGAHDNDCRQQQPGGPAALAKAIVKINDVGSRTVFYSIGAGGPGRGGNDAPGSGGGSTSVNIGNFNMNCGGGGGGSPNNTGGTGNANVNGPREAFSQSGVFSSTAVELIGVDGSSFSYLNMPTSSPGSGARCGDGASSAPGSNGFIYIRYGLGINASTSINPGQDPPSTGPGSSYTPFYG